MKKNKLYILKLKYSIWATFSPVWEAVLFPFPWTKLFVIPKYSSFFCCKLFLDEFELLLLPEFNNDKKSTSNIPDDLLYVEPLNSEVNLYAEVKIYCKFVRGGNFYCKSVQRGKSLLVEIRTPNFGQLFISVQ